MNYLLPSFQPVNSVHIRNLLANQTVNAKFEILNKEHANINSLHAKNNVNMNNTICVVFPQMQTFHVNCFKDLKYIYIYNCLPYRLNI